MIGQCFQEGAQMKQSGIALAALCAILLVVTLGAAPVPLTNATLSDGSIAKVYDHCGDADLCATIDYTNGDRLSFYSEGAASGQPYVVNVVRTNTRGTVFEYSRRIDRNYHEQLTLDRGNVHLDIDYLNDGTLRFRFSQINPPSLR
jgi:hypothetical protein